MTRRFKGLSIPALLIAASISFPAWAQDGSAPGSDPGTAFSDAGSHITKGAEDIGNGIKQGAELVGSKVKNFAIGVWAAGKSVVSDGRHDRPGAASGARTND